jgi:hypothetical protein
VPRDTATHQARAPVRAVDAPRPGLHVRRRAVPALRVHGQRWLIVEIEIVTDRERPAPLDLTIGDDEPRPARGR